MENMRKKLERAQRQITGLKEKAKYLEINFEDSRTREKNSNDLVMEMLERQKELNVMLNRANIMLHKTHETMALTSLEFNEMAKALPEPKKAEWSDRISKINDLFKQTGIQDAEVIGSDNSQQALSDENLNNDELKQESNTAFEWKDSIWNRTEQRNPPRVEATLIEEDDPTQKIVDEYATQKSADNDNDSDLMNKAKSWLRQKMAG
jgi:hypothetical protein